MATTSFIESQKLGNTAVLAGLINYKQDEEKLNEYLDELEFLATTANIKTLKRFTQKLEKPDAKTFLGKGKLDEIAAYIKENNVSTLIFDDELTPSQQKNIEKIVNCKVLDRTALILEIFAARAQTAHAKTQVQLAQYQYLLPRLTGLWTHLERQRGATGTRGGSGELQIESDRRIIRDKIALLKDKLKEIDKQMATQRKNRGELIRVSLVGYTNVGKSTIMNMLSKSQVFAENKLFATLDTTVRKVVIQNLPFLLSDTVGFIRKLPTQLVESFKSTLDEVREADILLHVVDISHPNFEEHIQVVHETLKEINALNKPMILVFNKIDAFKYVPKEDDDLTPKQRENFSLEELKNSWMARLNSPVIFISALHKENIEEMRQILYDFIRDAHMERYPHQLLY
jgi:GTP-binding protein HflX